MPAIVAKRSAAISVRPGSTVMLAESRCVASALAALSQIERERPPIEIGRTSEQEPGYCNDPEAEDVHHFVEKKLVGLVGETGKKLHSGRSRNEQIATDLRLFTRESIDAIRSLLGDFLETLLDRASDRRAKPEWIAEQLASSESLGIAMWNGRPTPLIRTMLEEVLRYVQQTWPEAAPNASR